MADYIRIMYWRLKISKIWRKKSNERKWNIVEPNITKLNKNIARIAKLQQQQNQLDIIWSMKSNTLQFNTAWKRLQLNVCDEIHYTVQVDAIQ